MASDQTFSDWYFAFSKEHNRTPSQEEVWKAALASREEASAASRQRASSDWSATLHRQLCMKPGACSECERIEALTTPPAATPAAPGEGEAFEAWVSGLSGMDARSLRRRDMAGSDRLGQYVLPIVECEWQAWQARSALSHPAPMAALAPVAKPRKCALCDEPARIGTTCDACHDSMGTKPAPASEADTRCPDCLGSEFPGWKRGFRCRTCKGSATVEVANHTLGDSVDAPVQQAEMALESLIVQWEHRALNSIPVDSMIVNKCIRELRAALKGEQPVGPSVSERGEV